MDIAPFRSYLRFARLARLPTDALPLAEGALLIAEIATPDMDVRMYQRRLDMLAAHVRAEVSLDAATLADLRARSTHRVARAVLNAMRLVLGVREEFHGNTDDYYDPRNSYLNEVLDRGLGLPITLAVVWMEVAARLGMPLVGVGLPAHFMAKWPLPDEEGGDLYVDAFRGGQVLTRDECITFVLRMLADAPNARVTDLDPRWLEPVTNRAILTRVLNNLKGVYLHRGESALALEVTERLVLLRPDLPEELRDRGLLRLALNEPLLAATDLAAYAERAPHAPELRRLLSRLARVREVRAKLN